jgi:uncharacterized Fe-S cluster-containing radical SAM superfamily protein
MREIFDPIERASQIEALVMENDRRKYYRFRYARFYGGICTADAVGCNLLCDWGKGKCWNYARNKNPATADKFFSPREVADKLTTLSEKNRCYTFRVSGCEPFLGLATANHYFEVLQLLKEYHSCQIIIETNGIYLGAHPELLDRIPPGCTLRISLKGEDEAASERITGARGAHALQMAAIQAASERNVRCRVAVMEGHCDISKVAIPRNVSVEKEKLSGRRA